MKGIKILQIALKMGSLLFGSLTVISVLSESSNQHIPEEPQVQVVSRKEAPAIVPLVINQTTEKVSSLSGTLYDVISVADGDTIKVWYNGSKQSVRILGIDTPEKFTTRTGQVECY
jgi:endonuclease YncB( thermonuclease family)